MVSIAPRITSAVTGSTAASSLRRPRLPARRTWSIDVIVPPWVAGLSHNQSNTGVTPHSTMPSMPVKATSELFGPTGTPTVVVVGAGFGGIAAGVKMKQAGIDTFTIYESSLGIGGTWWDNTYP